MGSRHQPGRRKVGTCIKDSTIYAGQSPLHLTVFLHPQPEAVGQFETARAQSPCGMASCMPTARSLATSAKFASAKAAFLFRYLAAGDTVNVMSYGLSD